MMSVGSREMVGSGLGSIAWGGKAEILLPGAMFWVSWDRVHFLGNLLWHTEGQYIGSNLPVEQEIVYIPYVPCSNSGELWVPFPGLGPREQGRERRMKEQAPQDT